MGEITAGGCAVSITKRLDSLHLLFTTSGGHAHDAIREKATIIIII